MCQKCNVQKVEIGKYKYERIRIPCMITINRVTETYDEVIVTVKDKYL